MSDPNNFEGSDYGDENYDSQEGPEELGKQLIKYSANGNLSEVTSLLKRRAQINYPGQEGLVGLDVEFLAGPHGHRAFLNGPRCRRYSSGGPGPILEHRLQHAPALGDLQWPHRGDLAAN